MAIAKKRKKFFNVEIPIVKKTTNLLAYELKQLDGKHIKYDLTRLLRGKSILLTAVVKVVGDEAQAVPKELKLLPYYLQRMVRKGTNYVEDSFTTDAKDAKIKIKPFLVTRRKVSRAVRNALHKKAREEIIEYAKTRTVEQIFEETIDNKLQKILSLKLKKIYPLSTCEIRFLKNESLLKEKSE